MKLLISAYALTSPELSPVVQRAREYFDEVVINQLGRRPQKEEMLSMWDGASAVLCGMEPFDKEMLEKAPPTLKCISRYGVGYNAIDCDAAKAAGIAVCNTPGINAVAVAEMTLCLMLSLARKTPKHDNSIRRGEWKRFIGSDLAGKRLGIVGLGCIGKLVAARAAAFDMKIQAYDLYPDDAFSEKNNISFLPLKELLETSDFISLHAPNTPETQGMISREAFGWMKPSAYLINTSRGELVDEEALFEACRDNKIAGAGIDVFQQEPLYESPLFSLDNVVLTPHQAANTSETGLKTGMMALENAINVCYARPCSNIVNK